jgi:S-DNA-T family DNA segregation ATPase FtsK/SpoIIIE
VVDEFAALARELPGFLGSLIGVAQRGRSLGVHLLLATQRPAGVVGDDIRANTNLRLALRLHDTADAIDVVGDDLPARFPRDRPGRVAMRLGPDELVTFQSARCTAVERSARRRLWTEPHRLRSSGAGDPPDAPDRVDAAGPAGEGLSELDRLVAAIGEAASLTRTAAPRRPWHDPLPQSVAPNDLEVLLRPGAGTPDRDADGAAAPPVDVVGVVDDPEEQCRHALRWREGSGNLALIGSLGSGTTTALLGVAAAQCRTASPARCHLYAIDGGGDPALDSLAALPHCGGVIRVQERERLARLLARLTGELDARTADTGGNRPRIVLLVDRLGALRSTLGTLDDALQLAQLDRLLADGAAVGISTVFTLDGASNTALTTPAGERWLFHIDDPAVARGLGAGRPVDDGMPGRMRIASSGLVAQVAAGGCLDALADRARTAGSRGGPDPIGVLPRVVKAGELRATRRSGAAGAGDDELDDTGHDEADLSVRSLPIGLASGDLGRACLRLPAGEHIFIGGLARTGRSTALARVAAAWSANVPGGRVVTARRADGPPRDLVGDCTSDGRQVLVTLDDAERCDDRDGWLRDVVAGAHPNVTIAVAAGLDAVRSGYGHWTREVARSRCGIILTAASEIDGDLLGVTLPRRSLVAARPGLGWLVDGSGHRLVQVALDEHPAR